VTLKSVYGAATGFYRDLELEQALRRDNFKPQKVNAKGKYQCMPLSLHAHGFTKSVAIQGFNIAAPLRSRLVRDIRV
jgi:hypothetical protein